MLLVFSLSVYAKNFGNASPNSTPMTSANTQDLTIMSDEDSNLNKATDIVSQTIHKTPNWPNPTGDQNAKSTHHLPHRNNQHETPSRENQTATRRPRHPNGDIPRQTVQPNRKREERWNQICCTRIWDLIDEVEVTFHPYPAWVQDRVAASSLACHISPKSLRTCRQQRVWCRFPIPSTSYQ